MRPDYIFAVGDCKLHRLLREEGTAAGPPRQRLHNRVTAKTHIHMHMAYPRGKWQRKGGLEWVNRIGMETLQL
eukprot:COSAG05_NODE_4463_length_1504_cov_2.386477_3_plen_73_part_00